jgi:hypothetical protein
MSSHNNNENDNDDNDDGGYDSFGFQNVIRDGVEIMVCRHGLEFCNPCMCDHRPVNNMLRSEHGVKEKKDTKKGLKKSGCAYPDCTEELEKLLCCTGCMLVAYWYIIIIIITLY